MVAIEVVGLTAPVLEEGDTVTLRARAIDAAGDTVPDAMITWIVVDTGQVGFTIEETTGLVTALSPGSGRVQARVETLVSGPIMVSVLASADSIGATGAPRLTVDTGTVASLPLTVTVWDLTSSPGDTLALAGKLVQFLTVDPAPGSAAADGFFITQADTVPGTDPHVVDVTTGVNGEASVVVRRHSGVAQPDSAAIDAISVTAVGDTVAGSPVRFTVVFVNN
ncbi:MAG: hypothetical protein OER90_19210 [Gemmatimonadota bacterium]|nr:hypothetical protein [Gemmatimonadota bacterium]